MLRSVHTPLQLYQRKMFVFVAIWFAGVCALGPMLVALGLWVFPLKAIAVTGVVLTFLWACANFLFVKQMSGPGGRLGRDLE